MRSKVFQVIASTILLVLLMQRGVIRSSNLGQVEIHNTYLPEQSTNLSPNAQKTLAVTPASGVNFCQAAQPCSWSYCPSSTHVTSAACGAYYPGDGHCWNGCSPTAAAVILNYWKENGYVNIYASLVDNMVQAMVDLRGYMGTNECGTTLGVDNQVNGIENYALARGFAFDAEAIYDPTFDRLVQEIDAGRPVFVSNGGHSFVCKGYDTNGQQLLIDWNLGSSSSNNEWEYFADLGLQRAIVVRPPIGECCCRYSSTQSTACSTQMTSTIFSTTREKFEPSFTPMPITASLQDNAPNESDHQVDSSPYFQMPILLDTELPASASYRLARYVIGTSGSYRTSMNYVMQGTSGQTTGVAQRQSDSYELQSGYWSSQPNGTGTTYQIYLPVVVRSF
jgi:hypothetical protein